jgi:hypothetical protein
MATIIAESYRAWPMLLLLRWSGRRCGGCMAKNGWSVLYLLKTCQELAGAIRIIIAKPD